MQVPAPHTLTLYLGLLGTCCKRLRPRLEMELQNTVRC